MSKRSRKDIERLIRERLGWTRKNPRYGIDPFLLGETNMMLWVLELMGVEEK